MGKTERGALLVCVVAVATAGAWATWPHHTSSMRRDGNNPPARRLAVKWPSPPPPTVGAVKLSASVAKSAVAPQRTLRDLFRGATDYAAFANSLRADAKRGRPDAQFYLAQALRYCQQNLGRFFIVPGGRTRTLNEAQERWATRPEGEQQEIVVIYKRCHAFLESPELGTSLNEWPQWLDKSVASAYPPAEMEKALVSGDADLLANGHVSEQDRDLALKAVQSGDPQVLWEMSNFVNQGNGPRQNLLTSSWQLLACERGFDCSAQADWVRSACTYDLNCSEGDTGVAYLKRQLGENAPEGEALANQIGAAIDSKDWSKLPSYLWTNPPAALSQY